MKIWEIENVFDSHPVLLHIREIERGLFITNHRVEWRDMKNYSIASY